MVKKKVKLLNLFVLISMEDDTGYLQTGGNNKREEVTLRFRCRQDFFKVGVTLTYFGFILWRFISLVLYSIHATDCFFREKLASYRCKNFTIFSHAKGVEISWQMSSTLYLLFLCYEKCQILKDIFLLFETTRSMPGSGRFSLS